MEPKKSIFPTELASELEKAVNEKLEYYDYVKGAINNPDLANKLMLLNVDKNSKYEVLFPTGKDKEAKFCFYGHNGKVLFEVYRIHFSNWNGRDELSRVKIQKDNPVEIVEALVRYHKLSYPSFRNYFEDAISYIAKNRAKKDQ